MTKLLQNESYTQVCTANRTQSGKVGICFKSKKNTDLQQDYLSYLFSTFTHSRFSIFVF